MLPVSELLEDIRAIRTHLDRLDKEMTELRKHVQGQVQPASCADLDKILAKVKDEARFVIDFRSIAATIQQHLATPAKLEAVVTPALNQMRNLLGQLPTSIPVVGHVWGFTSKRSAALVAGATAVLMLVLFWGTGMFSRVSEEKYQAMQARMLAEQARADRLSESGDRMTSIAKHYQTQIKAYQQKYPKSASHFPEYVIPEKGKPISKPEKPK